ncbi:MAG: hypothetical protein EPN39_15385 [Chitinophagaceae bacterium]|nr:MAG: hypothetical protein EPN39_15385 [Chitinophagaceae bacterium]
MVARFISGKSIEGALRYNEAKVQKGKANCIGASGYPLDKEELSFHKKLARLCNLAALNERVKTNCVHISLNFDPSEKISDDTLLRIALAYMAKIGFAGQPYLVYRHHDAGHPHIHIVSTNIQPDGKRIALHNIGRNQSETARKEIEPLFHLVPAESKKKEQQFYLKPVVAQKIIYGQSETKAAISNVVREVLRSWKFTSLAELNAILDLYNVIADSGKEGSRLYEKGGLAYSVLDEGGGKVGVPIKASAIYTKPTLSKLKMLFEENKEKRKPYRDRVRNCIEKALINVRVNSKNTLQSALEREGINVIYRENSDGKTYGITFLDMKAKVVFNGSDLGKNYSASAILRRLQHKETPGQNQLEENKKRINALLRNMDFSKGFAASLARLYAKGICIITEKDEEGNIKYLLGYRTSKPALLVPASAKFSAYLKVNHFTEELHNDLQKKVGSEAFKAFSSGDVLRILTNTIKDYLTVRQEYEGMNSAQRKLKRKRRKPNW